MLSQEPAGESSFWKYPQPENQQIRPCQVELFRIPQPVADRLHFRKCLRLDNLPWPLNHSLDKTCKDPNSCKENQDNSMSFAAKSNNMVQRLNGSVHSSDMENVNALQLSTFNTNAGKSIDDSADINGQHLSACRMSRENRGNRTLGSKVHVGLEGLQGISKSVLSETSASTAQCENGDQVPHVVNAKQRRISEHSKSTNIFDALSQNSEKECELLSSDVSLMCSWALKSSCFLKDCGSLDKTTFQPQDDQTHSKIVDVLCSTDKEYEAEEEVSSQPDIQDIDCASSESLRFYDMLLSSDEGSNDFVTAAQDTRVLSVTDNKDILSDVLDKVFFGDENSDSSTKDSVSPTGLQWHIDPPNHKHFQGSESLEDSMDAEQLSFTNALKSCDSSYSAHCKSAENVHESVVTLMRQLVNSVCNHTRNIPVKFGKEKLNNLDKNVKAIDHLGTFQLDLETRKHSNSHMNEIKDTVDQVVEDLLTSVSSCIQQKGYSGLHNQTNKCFTPTQSTEIHTQVSLNSAKVETSLEKDDNNKNIPISVPEMSLSSKPLENSLTATTDSSKPGVELSSSKTLTDQDPTSCKVVKEIVRAMSPDSTGIPTVINSSTILNQNRTSSPNFGSKRSPPCKRKLDSVTYSIVKECDQSSQSQDINDDIVDKDGKVPKLLIIKDAGISSDMGKKFVSKIVNDRCKKRSLKMSIKKILPKTSKDQFSKQSSPKAKFGNELKKDSQESVNVSQSSHKVKPTSEVLYVETAKEIPFDPYNFEYEDELCKNPENLEVPKLLHLSLSRSPSPSLLCYANIDSNHVIKSVNLEESEADETRESSQGETINNGVENLMKLLVTNSKDASACWKNRRGGNLKPITEDMLENMADDLGKEFEFDQEDIESFKQSAKSILTMVENEHHKKRRKWSRGFIEKRKPRLFSKDKEEGQTDNPTLIDPTEEVPVLASEMLEPKLEPEDDELSRISADAESYRDKGSITPSPSLSSVDNEHEGSQDSCYFANHCKRLTSLRNRRKRSSAADLEGMLTRMRSLRNRGGDDVLTVDFDDPIPLEYKERRKKRHHRRTKKQAYDDESATASPNLPEEDHMILSKESLKCIDETPEPQLGNKLDKDNEPKMSTESPCTENIKKSLVYRKHGSSRHTWLSSRWCSKRKRIHSTHECPSTSHSGDAETACEEKNIKSEPEPNTHLLLPATNVDIAITEVTTIVNVPQQEPTESLTSLNQSTEDEQTFTEDCSSSVRTIKESPLDLSRWTGVQQATSTVDNQGSGPSSPKSEDKDIAPDIDEYISDDSPLPAAPVGIVSSTSKFESNVTLEVFRSECSSSVEVPVLEPITEEKSSTEPMEVEEIHSSRPPSLVEASEVVDIDTDTDSGVDDLPRITSVISLANTEPMSDESSITEKSFFEDTTKLFAFQPVATKHLVTDVPLAAQTATNRESSEPILVTNPSSSPSEVSPGTATLQPQCPLQFPMTLTKDMFNAQYERLRNELMTLELIARQKERERNNIIRLKLYKQSVMRKLQLKKALMQQQMQLQAPQFMAASTSNTSGHDSEKQPLRYQNIAPRIFQTQLGPNYYMAAAAANNRPIQAQAKQVPTVSSSQSAAQNKTMNEKKQDPQENKTVDDASVTNSVENVSLQSAYSPSSSLHDDSASVSKLPTDTGSKTEKLTAGKNDPNSSLSSVETIVAKANENFGLQFQGWMEDSQRMLHHPYYQHAALAATNAQSPVKLDVPPKSILESSLRTTAHSRGLPLYASGLLTDVRAGDKPHSRSLDDVIRHVYSRKFNGVSSLPSFVPGFPMSRLYGEPMIQVPTVGNLGIPVFPQKSFAASASLGTSEFVKSEPSGSTSKKQDKISTSTPFPHSTLAKLLLSPLPDAKSQKETPDNATNDASTDRQASEAVKVASPLASTRNIPSSSSSSAWKPPDKTTVKWPICTSCKLMYARFICAGCNSQWYCSEPCQVRDWKYHFKTCRRV